jgi:hypothetical protein
MPVQTTDDALSHAFQLLCDVVRDSQSSGRICLGASLKLELQRRTRRGFNEQYFGFQRFGDFLRAAQSAGFIQLIGTPGGDLEIRLARTPFSLSLDMVSEIASVPRPMATSVRPNSIERNGAPAEMSSSTGDDRVRVRQDLWDAFNSNYGNWAYDRKNDAAYKVPPNLFGPTASNPNLVEIPAGRERIVEWMRSFANMQEGELKNSLLVAVGSDSAPFNFRKIISADWKLRTAWRRYHIQQVLAAIEAWATSNGLHPQRITSPLAMAAMSPGRILRRPWSHLPEYREAPRTFQRHMLEHSSASAPVPVVPAPVQASTPGALTSRIETLIDQLIDELLRLRGALQVVDRKQ